MIWIYNCKKNSKQILKGRHLEKDNKFLRKVIKTFEKTLTKFINWVCKKFSVSEEEDFIRDFKRETDTFINPERQIKYEQELEYDDLELLFSNKFSYISLIVNNSMLYYKKKITL